MVAARWQAIRTKYARERKKIRAMPSGSGAYRIWHLYASLQFLEEFVCERR